MGRQINGVQSALMQNSKLDAPFIETLSSLEFSVVLLINVEIEIVSRPIVFKSKKFLILCLM